MDSCKYSYDMRYFRRIMATAANGAELLAKMSGRARVLFLFNDGHHLQAIYRTLAHSLKLQTLSLSLRAALFCALF
jgi:hypothetical protein